MYTPSPAGRTRLAKAIVLAFVLSIVCCGKSFAAADWNSVENAMKTTGTKFAGNVLRFELVRQDLTVSVNGTVLPATQVASVANGYVSFKPISNSRFFADGALPAQESEVDALQKALRQDPKIKITAIVNHDIGESPKLVWVHFQATGEGSELATSIATALETIHSPQLNVSVISGTNSVFDTSVLPAKFMKLFEKGSVEQLTDIFVFYLPRPDEKDFSLGDVPAEAALGVGQSFYIQIDFSGGTNATLNIEFALRRDEVQPVSDILRNGGFTIAAQHNHFVNADPQLYYVHASGTGDGFTLGSTLYDAITTINKSVKANR
ncbi:DUF1259 domain-containing protein [Silvibacterium acidisoli]|uniref:DUF1259 domain-containing protein n=1 Tax=Acidobacteriaceae bacterium ZG23-2 TaxID=2883246 RepID=UPI00406D0C65